MNSKIGKNGAWFNCLTLITSSLPTVVVTRVYTKTNFYKKPVLEFQYIQKKTGFEMLHKKCNYNSKKPCILKNFNLIFMELQKCN